MNLEQCLTRLHLELSELSEKYPSGWSGPQYKQDVAHLIDQFNRSLIQVEESYKLQVEGNRSSYEWQISSLREEVARLEAKLKHGLDTIQESGDEGIMTFVKRPEGLHGGHRPWTIEEIEEMCYKLRIAGGEDKTSVVMEIDKAKAVLPFPEAILTPPARPKPDRKSEAELWRQAKIAEMNRREHLKTQLMIVVIGVLTLMGLGAAVVYLVAFVFNLVTT